MQQQVQIRLPIFSEIFFSWQSEFIRAAVHGAPNKNELIMIEKLWGLILRRGRENRQNLLERVLKKPISCKMRISTVVTKRLGTSFSNHVFNAMTHTSNDKDPTKKQIAMIEAKVICMITDFTSIKFMPQFHRYEKKTSYFTCFPLKLISSKFLEQFPSHGFLLKGYFFESEKSQIL